MSRAGLKRSRARLAAAQALYQMELSGQGAEDVIEQFTTERLGHLKDGDEGEALGDADDAHFAALVRGVVESQVPIDKLIDKALSEGWALERIDATVRGILRAAVFELTGMPDIPAKVVIDEYVHVAKAFFDGNEPKFVNGILNTVAREKRAAEFPA